MTQELKYKEGYEAALNDVVEWLNENIYQYVFWDTENYEIYVSKIELINHLTRELSPTLKTD